MGDPVSQPAPDDERGSVSGAPSRPPPIEMWRSLRSVEPPGEGQRERRQDGIHSMTRDLAVTDQARERDGHELGDADGPGRAGPRTFPRS